MVKCLYSAEKIIIWMSMIFSELIYIPALILIAGAFIIPVLPAGLRSPVFMLFPIISLYIVWIIPEGYTLTASAAGYDLVTL
jgi:multicomponent Na+:H+ antiporter subunit D